MFPTPAIKYCVDTWLVWAEKLVSCWVDEIPHFRNKTTSRLEGMHKLLKDYVQSPAGDMKTVYDRLMLFWSNQRENILTKQMNHQRSRKNLSQKEIFRLIKDYVYDNCLDHLWAEYSKLPKDGSRPEKPCTGLIKRSMGIPCSHDLWLLRESGHIHIKRNMIHKHWFIERPKPGYTFPDDDSSIIMDPKMRNNAIDKRRAYKKARHGGRRRGVKQADRIISTFEHECLDYARAPTYSDQVTVPNEPQNRLSWEAIAAKHRQERAILISNARSNSSSVAPPNYSFSSSTPHPMS
ncbi:hypothetical protein OnM2_047084 [Erysiphe neolycopersici]|uniref:Uncharacterized protein n=1 Tax=Erysiphe neolycopersici TaxID=212602 RepID=A0A420HTJ5_9PEZI|nr:hypothetical protein OnM2_047084 [Erysiphe neolycopersici]